MNKGLIDVDGEAVFTAQYMLEQMQALLNLYKRTKTRCCVFQWLTVLALLLSLLAIMTR